MNINLLLNVFDYTCDDLLFKILQLNMEYLVFITFVAQFIYVNRLLLGQLINKLNSLLNHCTKR